MKWQEPPRSKSGPKGNKSKYLAIMAELQQHPGEWALVLEQQAGRAFTTWVHQGRSPWVEGEYEATSRINPVKGFDVYVRYIGGEQ